MQEQQIINNLQQIIDLATKTTLMLKNHANKDQQKLPSKKSDAGGEDNNMSPPRKCSVPGCEVTLSNPDHTLCYKHWQEANRRIEEA